jgi:hypothetical protein
MVGTQAVRLNFQNDTFLTITLSQFGVRFFDLGQIQSAGAQTIVPFCIPGLQREGSMIRTFSRRTVTALLGAAPILGAGLPARAQLSDTSEARSRKNLERLRVTSRSRPTSLATRWLP